MSASGVLTMKINWKIAIAAVVVLAALFWAFESVRPRSYEGEELNFGIGSGPVTVTNTSDAPVAAQLVGTGARSFTVASDAEGIAGTSVRQGSGRTTTQVFDLTMPPGLSVFTVAGGANVNFLANTTSRVEATVQPNENEARTVVLIAVVVIAAALFYMSHVNGHRWISASRRQQAADAEAHKVAERETFQRMFSRVASNPSGSAAVLPAQPSDKE
jgi:hypothetical protein